MNELEQLNTPAALIDIATMNRNIQRMQAHVSSLGAKFRPHVKTTKCLQVAQAQRAAGASGITVSTLKEAQQFFAAGFSDILYAVGVSPNKFEQALALRRAGCDLKLVVDNPQAARLLGEFGAAHGHRFEVWIEVDTDGHRSGVSPDEPHLVELGRTVEAAGSQLGGVLTHAGSSYDLNNPEALAALAEVERAGCVHAAERLRDGGLACPVVSIGSTPTALAARSLAGVTEVRAGVYVFFDLVMSNVGVCGVQDIGMSVLSTVIGHQPEKGWAIIDAGWMAMSRDRGTQKQARDFAFGQVCDLQGRPMDGYLVTGANQEHGIISREGVADAEVVQRFPIGSQVRILPNHACATGAQFPQYQALLPGGAIETWQRFQGW